jgi:hypothetical protein
MLIFGVYSVKKVSNTSLLFLLWVMERLYGVSTHARAEKDASHAALLAANVRTAAYILW